MYRKTIAFAILGCLILLALPFGLQWLQRPYLLTSIGTEIGSPTDPYARQTWEHLRLADPATGHIPQDIHTLEARFVAQLSGSLTGMSLKRADPWQQRGPHNIGGRTRALAYDIRNPDILLAAGVTGGVYRSTDGGKTWTQAKTPGNRLSVTDMIQDKRSGREDNWYLCTGEIIGNLTRYPGDGIYQSTDNGLTWKALDALDRPQETRLQNYGWRLVLDHSRTDSSVLYLASWGALLRSADGGYTWATVLGGKASSAYRTGSDVVITPGGVLYATLSSNSPKSGGGIWRSTNGWQWTNIKPLAFPATVGRVVMDVFQANDSILYFLGYTPNKGKYGESHSGNAERNSLWRYKYLGGNGADDLGEWTDRSDNIPDLRQTSGYVWGDFLSQGGYNLVCRIHPRSEDSIVIGGTNLYASTDGFTTGQNTTWIGGYIKTKDRLDALYNGLVYPNHHPDQHGFLLDPHNPDQAWSTNDGGIQWTESVWEKNKDVVWQNLNNGFYTTQFYTIAINQSPTANTMSDLIIGGFQDNETQYVPAQAKGDANWLRMACCDGAYASIFDDGDYTYVTASKQLGVMYLLKFDKDGKRLGGNRADPDGGVNYLFINPFISNPNAPHKLYLAGGNFIWRNGDIRTLPLDNSDAKTTWNWTRLTKARTGAGQIITALDCSTKPGNVLYYGTQGGELYRIDNVEAEDPSVATLVKSGNTLDGSGYISSISVDPHNANEVLLCFSNYNRKSIYHTTDGGETWRHVSGNLEENSDGSGAGPGCNVVKIIRKSNSDVRYLVGTTSGLFYTGGLPGNATVWNKEGGTAIGNCSVRDIDFRPSDGLLVLGTHGCGSFSAHIDQITTRPNRDEHDFSVYPNPALDHIQVQAAETISRAEILGMDGKVLISAEGRGNNITLPRASLPAGNYLIKIFFGKQFIIKPIVFQ